jgi:hypothetical protein
MLVQQHVGRQCGPKSAYLVLTNSTAYFRMPSFLLRFDDATSKLMQLRFVPSESTGSYLGTPQERESYVVRRETGKE